MRDFKFEEKRATSEDFFYEKMVALYSAILEADEMHIYKGENNRLLYKKAKIVPKNHIHLRKCIIELTPMILSYAKKGNMYKANKLYYYMEDNFIKNNYDILKPELLNPRINEDIDLFSHLEEIRLVIRKLYGFEAVVGVDDSTRNLLASIYSQLHRTFLNIREHGLTTITKELIDFVIESVPTVYYDYDHKCEW